VAAVAAAADTLFENETTAGSVELNTAVVDGPDDAVDDAPNDVDVTSEALGLRIAAEAMSSYCRTSEV
jgi:hypothetical protein